jgi:hypothetical protein
MYRAPTTLRFHTLSLPRHLLAARATRVPVQRHSHLTVAMASSSAAGPKVGFFGAGMMCEALAKGFIRYTSSCPSLPPPPPPNIPDAIHTRWQRWTSLGNLRMTWDT